MALQISPLSGHTGAQALGVDLSSPLDSDTQARLNDAFIRHSVLVIRDQKLTAPQLLRAVQQFGRVFEMLLKRFLFEN